MQIKYPLFFPKWRNDKVNETWDCVQAAKLNLSRHVCFNMRAPWDCVCAFNCLIPADGKKLIGPKPQGDNRVTVSLLTGWEGCDNRLLYFFFTYANVLEMCSCQYFTEGVSASVSEGRSFDSFFYLFFSR